MQFFEAQTWHEIIGNNVQPACGVLTPSLIFFGYVPQVFLEPGCQSTLHQLHTSTLHLLHQRARRALVF